MKLKDQIDEAVRTHDIRDVVNFPRGQKVVLCPLPFHLHRHNTPSFSIFVRDGKQYWKCHGNCNMEGDVVDLVGFLSVPGYSRHDPRLVEQALTKLSTRYEPKFVKIEEEPKLVGNEWRAYLPAGQRVIEYAATRGLTPDTLKKFKIGQNVRWMTIPCFENGLLRGIKMRNIYPDGDGRYPRYIQYKGSRQGLFNFDVVNMTLSPVLVVKAEIPCMLLDQLGLLACAPTGGEGGWQENWRTALALSSRRVVVGDNDEAGVRLGERRAAFLSAELKFPPKQYKDVDQWIIADKQIALETIRRWLEA